MNESEESRLSQRLDNWIEACTMKRGTSPGEVDMNKIRRQEKPKHKNGKWKSMEKLLAFPFKDNSNKKNP